MDILGEFKAVIDYVIVPLAVGTWWYFKRLIGRLDGLDTRTTNAEKAILVMESQMSDIRKDIDEIKTGINKLIDRLCK